MHPEDSISTADQSGAKTQDCHCPSPWEIIGEQGTAIWHEDHMVAQMSMPRVNHKIARANARRIVTAVNAHEELVEALRDLSYASKHARANHYKSEFGLRAAEDKANGLLAKLKS